MYSVHLSCDMFLFWGHVSIRARYVFPYRYRALLVEASEASPGTCKLSCRVIRNNLFILLPYCLLDIPSLPYLPHHISISIEGSNTPGSRIPRQPATSNMADFTGATVKVTLKQPPNTVLHGRVREVAAGSLALEDVFFPNTGARWPQWTVQGAAIADIEVIGKDEEQSAPPQMPPMHHQQQQQQHHMPSMQQHMPMQRSMHPGQMPMPMHMQQHPNTGFAPPPMPMPMPMHMQQGPPSAMMAHPPPVPIHMQRPPSASMSPAPMPTTTRPSSGATQRAPSVPNPQHPSASVTPSPMPAQAQDSAPSANQNTASLPDCAGHADTAEAVCHVR
jgi:hypothetical protein